MSLHQEAKQHEHAKRHAFSLAQASDDEDEQEPLSLGEDFADQEDWKGFLNVSNSNRQTGKREDKTADAVERDEADDVSISDDFADFEDGDKQAVDDVEGNENLTE